MVPKAYVTLEALPRSPNGKVDRHAFPPPNLGQREQGAVCLAGEGAEGEKMLAAIWEELLGMDPVGIEDDFFGIWGVIRY